MSRRMERAMALPSAGDLSVTEVCFAVGFSSLGSFSTQFRRFVGDSPSAYRQRDGHAELAKLPSCYVGMWTRCERVVVSHRLPERRLQHVRGCFIRGRRSGRGRWRTCAHLGQAAAARRRSAPKGTMMYTAIAR